MLYIGVDMRNKFTYYVLIISLLFSSFVMYTYSSDFSYAITITCGFLMICIIQLISVIYENNYRKLCIIELILLSIIYYYGNEFVIYLSPIVIFAILSDYLNTYIIYIITLIILIVLSKWSPFAICSYDLMICILLDEVKKNHDILNKLKSRNRNSRSKTYDLKQKLFFLDKYIDQSKAVTSLKERNYIAQKMHDSLGHRITASLMQLEVTKEMIGSNDELGKECLKGYD